MSAPAWTTNPYDTAAAVALQDALGLGPAAAAILVRRGHGDPGAARAFLAADTVTDPQALPGAQDACALVLRHVEAGSRILVFGDYDVDGVCSTAMMVRTLRDLGADPVWQLPSRAEGYGLGIDAVERIAGYGTALLITVDCGVTSVAEVARARELGMDVLVTDHHRPGAELPDCVVVHPALGPEGAEGEAGELCAAGVVLKLSAALYAGAGRDAARADRDLDLAGLATVCDMVPLRGENRRIAREGMAAVAATRKAGLRALMRVADLEPGDVDAQSAGFRLGPRINAAGRLQRADAALELMLTDDDDRAAEVARELDLLNRDRRETEQRILHAAEALCAPQLHQAALVVAGEGWHPGVVGIVASRLVERFRRPAVVIGLDGDAGRGSGRSIPAYDLHAGLGAAARHLTRFGGHRMAAGLEIGADAIDALRAALAAHAGAALAPADLTPSERVDAVVPGGALTLDAAEELERLGPFGPANPQPRLLVPAAGIEHVTAMGEERQHARFSLVGGGARARGVAFRRSQRSLAAAGAQPQDAVVSLERNRWNGAVEARVVLRAISPTRPGVVREVGETGLWDGIAAELAADPARWWPEHPALPRPARIVRERHREGLAGLAGDLLTSGAPVLVVVADVARRRAGLERTSRAWRPAASAWSRGSRSAAEPGARPSVHRTCWPWTRPRSARAWSSWPAPRARGSPSWPGAGRDRVHPGLLAPLARRARRAGRTVAVAQHRRRAWTAPSWTRRCAARARIRATAALAGRMLRVLAEAGLVEVDVRAREVLVVSTERTSLDRSPAFRAYATRLDAALRHLDPAVASAA